MFALLTAVIVYSLLTYGAVLASHWFLLDIIWYIIVAGWLTFQAVRGRPWKIPFVIVMASLALLTLGVQLRMVTGLMAGIWAWLAASRNHKWTLRFFNVLILIGVLEAFLGLLQFFVSPGWIFGYVNESSRTSGTLINRNHFAGLMEMLLPVAFGHAYISARRFGEFARPYLYLLATAFMGLALLFSVSRMGIFSFLTTLCFCTVVLQWRKSQGSVGTRLALGMGALLAAGALWIGVDIIIERYSELVGDDAFFREGRLVIYADAAKMIMANPLGVGTGNFQDRFRQYQTIRSQFLFDHAHNDYLETAAEWGVPVAVFFWIFLLYSLVRATRLFVSLDSVEERGVLLACIGAMFSILVHSIADFNLQIPSNAMLFFTFVGISLAMPLRQTSLD